MTSLKSTTPLAMCAVLSFPQVSFGAEHAGLPMCGEAPEAPCLLDGGLKLAEGATDGLAQCPDPVSAEAAPCAVAEGLLVEPVDESAAQAMAREIQQLDGLTIAVQLPDISRSLRALEAALEQRTQQGGVE